MIGLAGAEPLVASAGEIALDIFLALLAAGFVLLLVVRILRRVVASFRFERLPEPPIPEPEPTQSPDKLDHLFLERLITAEEHERLRAERTAHDVTDSPES